MIRLTDVTLARGTKILFRDASAVMHPGERLGLIGANGSGKSSLFGLLRGELSHDSGNVEIPPAWRIASVAQEDEAVLRSVTEHIIDGDVALRAIEGELAAVELQHDAGDHGSGEALALLHERLAHANAYTARARAETLLYGLGFKAHQFDAPVASLSGGWRKRLELGRTLMAPSDLLLLDEPTNHLDLDAIVWLEQWLARYPGTLLVVSHDREFLDAVCGAVFAIEDGTLRRYTGNYSSYELQAAEARRQRQGAYERQQRDVAHLQKFIDRFKAKASKARQAQSRVKALERMEMIAPLHAASPFSFRFREPQTVSDPLLVAENLTCGYVADDTTIPILTGVQLTIRNGERIGLLGANGQGKSTLIKTLAGSLAPLAGELVCARNLAVGYFAQQQVDMLRSDDSPLRSLARVAPDTREQELRNYLGGFDFRGDVVSAPIAPLSGGEKARLALALIIWQRPSLLLLDEPTNHLDLETRSALSLALAQFEGTLVLVSHDRALLQASADRLLIVAQGTLKPFDGDLEDYRAFLLGINRPPSAAAANSVPASQAAGPRAGSGRPVAGPSTTTPASAPSKNRGSARSAAATRRRPIETRIQRVEAQLAKFNEKRAELEAALAAPETYQPEQQEQLREWLVEQAYTAREIERLEAEWLEQQALLDAVEN